MDRKDKTICFFDIENDTAEKARESRCGYVLLRLDVFNSSAVQCCFDIKSATHKPKIYLNLRYIDAIFAKAMKAKGLIDGWNIGPFNQSEYKATMERPFDPLVEEFSHPSSERIIRDLEPLIYTDEITDLYNRRFLKVFLDRIFVERVRFDTNLSLFLFDIDNLKDCNNRYGHIAGDAIIKQAGVAMKKCFRSYDITARVGGDEFMVVMWDLPDKFYLEKSIEDNRNGNDKAQLTAENLAERFAEHFKTNSSRYGDFTISGGLVHFTNKTKDFDEIYSKVDKKLLSAKSSGKDKIVK